MSVLAFLTLAAILGILLYSSERRYPHPLIDPNLLAQPGMRPILMLSFFQGVAMYSTLFFMSFYAQTHPDIQATAAQAGALLTPGAAA